jgi:murein DD-endopeptidase MepM/ murein hydrolase activator NlpD
LRQATALVRRALARVPREQRRAAARVAALRARLSGELQTRRLDPVHGGRHARAFAHPARLHLPRRSRITARLSRPHLGAILADRRLAPVLVLVLVLGAMVVAALPSATAAIGDTSGTGQAAYPAIAGLRGAAVADPIEEPATAPVDEAPGFSIESASNAAEGSATLTPSGDYALDGTLVKPLSADAIATAFQMQVYVVKSGDTLTGIAGRFGLSPMTIWWANKLTSKDELHLGQKLFIPPVDGVVYTVKDGDSLDAIAAKFRADPDTIMAYNALETEELAVGQQLMIPDGVGAAIASKPAPKAVPRSTTSTSRSSGGSSSGCSSCSFSGRMTWPVPGGYISQGYHYGHWAIDIAAPYGSRIIAAAAGKVTFAGWRNNGGGYQVWISHGNNLYTTYNHMSSVAVYAGQYVGRGQFVGRVGATGDATGPHCHFEVWIGPIWAGGHRVNPLNYL